MDNFYISPIMPNGFRLAPGQSFLICPYNPTHMVTNVKFTSHILKCRAAYAEKQAKEGKVVYMKKCRYFHGHILPEIELLHHEQRCPAQNRIIPGFQDDNVHGFVWTKKELAKKQKVPGEFICAENPDQPDEEEGDAAPEPGPSRESLLMDKARAVLKKAADKKANGSGENGNDGDASEEEEDWELECLVDRLKVDKDYKRVDGGFRYGNGVIPRKACVGAPGNFELS